MTDATQPKGSIEQKESGKLEKEHLLAKNSYLAPDGSGTESRQISHVSGDSPFIAQHES